MKEHEVKIHAVRRIKDIMPNCGNDKLGIYDPGSKTIFIAEEMYSLGQWRPNFDVLFEIRHEFGHAYNATARKFGDWVSDEPRFRAAFKLDFEKLSMSQLQELQLTVAEKSCLAVIRDEVFSDIYAHSTGCISKNPYSQKLKAAFPNCLKYAKEEFTK